MAQVSILAQLAAAMWMRISLQVSHPRAGRTDVDENDGLGRDTGPRGGAFILAPAYYHDASACSRDTLQLRQTTD